MRIYALEYDNGEDYEDNYKEIILITENISLFKNTIYELLEDEDFIPGGDKEKYSYGIYIWENGKSTYNPMFYIAPYKKMKTFEFLESFK